MKLHITAEDLSQLNENQKKHLNEIWKPAKYDLAIAFVCTDVAEEKYQPIEFVIGNIDLYADNRMLLHDIRTPAVDLGATDDDAALVDEEDSSFDEVDDEYYEEDADFEFIQPASFTKEDCLPLLNIGQMIELLQNCNFGYNEFYLSAAAGNIGCVIGKNTASWDSYANESEPAELCDVLWESVKAVID